jgi:thiamine-phosphate pyrophosphorylase
MTRRQSMPQQWLILDTDRDRWSAVRRLARGSGVLLIHALSREQAARLRRLAWLRGLTVVAERPRTAARVHDVRELRRAVLRRTPLILLSPIFPTHSHLDWKPLPRMRAAALARLTGRKAIALGGMSQKRYAKVAPLGFIGWAGISAFRT